MYLGHQSLEEAGEAFVLGHIGQDHRKPLSGLSKFLFWMRVLMTSSGADTTSGGGRAGDGGDEILEPGCFVVVLQLEKELLRERRTAEELTEKIVS